MKNILYVTYCSAEKNESADLMPAISRYLSKRIETIYDLAKADQAAFGILSGKYGLLNPEDKIPYYDHLLAPLEARPISKLVASQIEKMALQKIVFFMEPLDFDPNLAPYFLCISLAANEAMVDLEKRVDIWR